MRSLLLCALASYHDTLLGVRPPPATQVGSLLTTVTMSGGFGRAVSAKILDETLTDMIVAQPDDNDGNAIQLILTDKKGIDYESLP